MAASAFSLAADEPPSMRCRYYRTTRLDTTRYARALLGRAPPPPPPRRAPRPRRLFPLQPLPLLAKVIPLRRVPGFVPPNLLQLQRVHLPLALLHPRAHFDHPVLHLHELVPNLLPSLLLLRDGAKVKVTPHFAAAMHGLNLQRRALLSSPLSTLAHAAEAGLNARRRFRLFPALNARGGDGGQRDGGTVFWM